ncbi:MAG: PD40 domain-containing protein, partial [Deltaproteobacteria bacterium]|nr:PD40 domain-containing protein [Deltaproteobacteria bacterium]
MMRSIGRVAVTVFLALALFPPVAGAVLYIDINAPGGKRMPLAVGSFVVNAGAAGLSQGIPKILEADLALTELFDLVPRDAHLESVTAGHFGGTPLDFPSWKTIGAEAVVIGRVDGRGEQLTVEMRLYDATQGILMLGKRYSCTPRQVSSVAHKFANEIVYVFTGVRGIFGTDIAFSARQGKAKEIYLVGMDGKDLRKVTNNRSYNLFPRWSPDGRWLSFTSFRTGVPVIYLHNPETGAEKEIVRAGGAKAPGGFSPDGVWLYYSVSNAGNSDIRRTRVAGGGTE